MIISKNVEANRLSTYGGKGVVKTLVIPENKEEFVDVIRDKGDDAFILGGGSNLIIPDGENTKTVVSTKCLNHIEIDGDRVRVDGGARVSSLIKECRLKGLTGLEFLVGVPASIGGAVKMNAGAFNCEIGSLIAEITVLSADGDVKTLFPPFLFSYRKGCGDVVLDVTLNLKPADTKHIDNLLKHNLAVRHSTQPRGRSVGCTFKNVGLSAGYYIDKAGLKGERVGGAEISTLHGNFIVNRGEGSATDFLTLVERAKTRVEELFQITLEEEFILLGEQ